MSFLFPSLAIAGGVLALAPIIAHLLNRRRRKRVAWAAMDFLLESERRNRTWVRLSEWLLLASRVAAVALAGVLAAGPRVGDSIAGWLDGGETVHLVLLDDSYSMQQRHGDTTAWRHATQALRRLVEATAEGESNDGARARSRLIVARYSDPVTAAESINEPLDASSPALWRRRQESQTPTSLAVGPVEAAQRLEAAAREATARGAACYAYVLSDFQHESHERDDRFRAVAESLAAETSGLVLAPCGDGGGENLTLEGLELAAGPVASGVETRLRITVTNQGAGTVGPVSVRLTRDGQPLPAVTIGPFESGQRRVETLPIAFPGEGVHTVVAELPSDPLAPDDKRSLAIDLPASQRVLVVDGSREGAEGLAYSAALSPNGATRTGWRPDRVTAPRPETLGDLSETAVVLLLDVQRLASQAESELRRFVEAGGGLLVSLGPNAQVAFYNDRFVGEGGLVPRRIDLPTPSPLIEPGRPALAVRDHPAFRLLSGAGEPFLPLVRVALRHTLVEEDPERTPGDGGGGDDSLIAFTDRSPLVIESRLGKGRVVTLLTAAAARDEDGVAWSNLARLPIFPVVANELVGWLAAERLRPREVTVGESTPVLTPTSAARLQRLESASFVDVTTLAAGESAPVTTPGVYRVAGLVGDRPVLFAANVDPREGRLAAPTEGELRRRHGAYAKVTPAEDLFRDPSEHVAATATHATAAALLLLLAAERWLAKRCSYVDSRPGDVA